MDVHTDEQPERFMPPVGRGRKGHKNIITADITIYLRVSQ